jgi:PAS domain S-box-containing protein
MSTFSNKTFEQGRTEISFREILEFAPIGILIFQRDWTVKFVNANFFLFPGVLAESPGDVIGMSIYENRLFEKIDIRTELDHLKTGEGFEKQITVSKSLKGTQVTLLLKGTPILLNDDNAGGILIIEDAKVNLEKTLPSLSTLNEFSTFLKHVSDYYIISTVEGLVEDESKQDDSKYEVLIDSEFSKQGQRRLSPILFKKHLETVVESRKLVTAYIPFIQDGIEIQSKISLVPVSDSENVVDKIILLMEDVGKQIDLSGLTKIEIEELSRYQQIASGIADGLIAVNKNGRIIFWNDSSAKLFGLTKSEVYGKYIGKIFPSLDEPLFEKLKNYVDTEKLWSGNLSIGFDDSVAEHFLVKITSLNDAGDQSYLFLCANITKMVREEKELRESEEVFRSIVTNSPDYICTLDSRGFLTFVNNNFLDAFKYSQNEYRKINFKDLIDSEYLLNNSFELESFSDQKNSSTELPLANKSGHKIYVHANFTALKNEHGEVVSYNAILTDVTLTRESEKDLLLIRSVFEASVDGIALIHKKKFVLVNDSFVKMFGYSSSSDLYDENPLNLIDKKDKLRISGFLEAAGKGDDSPARYLFLALRKNKSIFDAENSVSFYEVEGERFIVWVLRDVTEEKQSQQALLASEERYRSITQSINECIWAAENIKGELKAVFYTPAIRKITSYDPDDFLHDEELWGKIIHPDDVDFVGDKMDQLYGDPVRNLETLEYRIIDKLGNVIWIENKITVVRDPKGKIQKVFGIISDVTLSKRAEEELKKSAEDFKELNETKDRFISIVSHDLRTPFSSIIGFTDILLNEKDLEEEVRMQYIQFIQESSKSMLGLVNSLMDLTRLQTGRTKFEPERINAKYLIDKSIQVMAGAALQKKISIVNEIKNDFYIHADEGLLFQAFNNLISNAIKFTGQDGSININSKANVEKKQVEFSVRDNGVGIKKNDLEKLFKIDTKFTTSGTAGEKGSGLGLSLVHDIVRKHGGDIWVNSEYGQGTQFVFSIPVASSNLLLVDDIKTDRLLYSKLIKSLVPNYNIIEAENGKQALDIIKQSSPALIITDHNMPVMSGYDLVKQMNMTQMKFKPPVIVLSSDLNKSIEAEYREFGVEYIFNKPVNLSNFKNAIERSLRKAIFS